MVHGAQHQNAEVERLAEDVAALTGESKTEAIRKALEERRRRLKRPSMAERRQRVLRFLKRQVWSTIPKRHLGRRPTRAEESRILGYGPEGV
jgi:antitoxin VapB